MANKPAWAVLLGWGPLLIEDSEADAIECQQIAEYECGWSAIIYRPDPEDTTDGE